MAQWNAKWNTRSEFQGTLHNRIKISTYFNGPFLDRLCKCMYFVFHFLLRFVFASNFNGILNVVKF